MNHIAITGNITKDVELRFTPEDKAVGNFSVAYNEKYKDKETVSFFDVVVWGKTAENCAKYVGKGSKVLVEGSLRQESWEKDGQKHFRIKIIAHRVEFIGKPKDQAQDQEPPAPSVDQEVPF